MRFCDAVRLAAVNLQKNPMRTLLTILGLGVGIGAILTVLTLGNAGEQAVRTEIARLGVNKLRITADDAGERQLRADDGQAVAAAASLPACAEAAAMGVVRTDERAALCQVTGVDAGMNGVYNPELADGRLFAPQEYTQGNLVALLDTQAAECLAASVRDWIHVENRLLRVVGIIEPMTSALLGEMQGSVVLPLRTWLDTYEALGVSQITVDVPMGADYARLETQVIERLAARGGSFNATAMTEEIEAVEQVLRIFGMVLACVAAVCMLTGAIGVMNILLVSVRERRREIGLMKAVGATSFQIGRLFLLEAVTYAALGGVLGLVFSLVMIRWFGGWIGLETALNWNTALPTMGAAVLLGVGFGVVPALRAAGLEPVTALRQE